MFSTTPQKLINLALKKIGVLAAGQTPLADDITDAFDELNLMLGEWNAQRWLVYHLVTQSTPSTGAESYTIGPGAGTTIQVPLRPNTIESAFFRQNNITPLSPDYPLEVVLAREDYNRIRLKNLSAFPQYLFYDSGWPVGTLYPWPLMMSGLYELFVSYKDTLRSMQSTDMQVNLPPQYYTAILYNLALRLRPGYQLPMDPVLMALAQASLSVVRESNAQVRRLRMPSNLISRGSYNPYSDQGS